MKELNASQKTILEKAECAFAEFERLAELLEAPEILADGRRWRIYAMKHSSLSAAADEYNRLRGLLSDCAELERENGEAPDEFAELLAETDAEIEVSLNKLQILLQPESAPGYGKTALRITAADPSEESKSFAQRLLDIYAKYARRNGFEPAAVSDSQKYTCYSGKGVYLAFAAENRLHKETTLPGGRTAAARVLVIPVELPEEKFNENDVKFSFFHCGGKGGQNVNKVETGVRAVHLPTGIALSCTEERSQLQNKNKVLARLRERVAKAQSEKAFEAFRNAETLQSEISASMPQRIYDSATLTVTDPDTGAATDFKSVQNGDLKIFAEAHRLKYGI